MKNARGQNLLCQEVRHDGLPCGEDAVTAVDNGDHRPYWMCLPCATHNVRNRGALLLVVQGRQTSLSFIQTMNFDATAEPLQRDKV